MPLTNYQLARYAAYFRDPHVGDGLLTIGATGDACRNVRKALEVLGFNASGGDDYDDKLQSVVKRFQLSRKHSSRDGNGAHKGRA